MTIQLITAAQALYPRGITGPNNSTARPSVLYVLDKPPHTMYHWDGFQMVPLAAYDASGKSLVRPDGVSFDLDSLSKTRALTTIVIGNSIAGGGNQGPGRDGALNVWGPGSDVHFASQLTGGNHIRWGRMTASTRTDAWGVYSYSGQTLDTINADLPAQLYVPLATANVVPELVIGHSLLENDVAAGATVAQMVSRLKTWLINVQMRYPGAIVWLLTPRPSFSYNSAAKVQAFKDITSYILALDDGKSIFASQMNAYESFDAPGTPLAGFTDATVHPNVRGGHENGRTLAKTLLRIASAARFPYGATSNNMALAGSGAVSGSGVSGTWPTGCTVSAPGSTTTVASLAADPGWQLEYTQLAGTAVDISTLNTGAVQVTDSGTTLFSPFMKVRVDSGGEHIRGLFLQARGADGTTSPFYTFQGQSTANSDGSYRDGDVLTLRMPPVNKTDFGTANPLTSITPYLRLNRKTGGAGATTVLTAGAIRFTVLASGVAVIA